MTPRMPNQRSSSVTALALLASAVAALLGGCAGPGEVPPVTTSGSLQLTPLGRLAFGGAEARSVTMTDGLCFVGCGEAGVRIIDVTDPTAPERLATIDDVRADHVAWAEDQLWILGVEDGMFGDTATLTVIDVIDPRLPGVRRTTTFPVGGEVALSAEGASACIAAGTDGARVVTGRALVVESADSVGDADVGAALARRGMRIFHGRDGDQQVVFIATNAEPDSSSGCAWVSDTVGPSDLALCGDVLLVANEQGVQLVDVVDATSPESMGTLPIAGARAIAARGRYGVVARRDESVVALDLTVADRPQLAATVQTPGAANDVAILGDLIAVADGDAGIALIVIAPAESAPAATAGP